MKNKIFTLFIVFSLFLTVIPANTLVAAEGDDGGSIWDVVDYIIKAATSGVNVVYDLFTGGLEKVWDNTFGKLFGDNEPQPVPGAEEQATEGDVLGDEDTLENKNIVEDANQQAYQKIAELNAKLRSDLVKYDTKEEGATGDLWAEIYAPSKVYGFSAFPVQVKIYTRNSSIPFSYVHIRSVNIYIIGESSSNPLWTRTWDYGEAGSEGLNGESVVYSTILKVPDPYVYQVEQMISTGSISKDLIQELFNATTESWEIYVDIDAYREIWQSDPSYTDQTSCENAGGKWDSNTNTCYVFVRNADINYRVYTTSAWRHVTRANDVAILDEGMYASLPIKFIKTAEASKWALYQEEFAGALSNFIIITYANPVHVVGSTADYKFYIAPNPGYFDPINVTFTDEFRFAAIRVYKDEHWELADSIFGTLGTLSGDSLGVEKLLTARYTEDPDALTYKVFGMALFTITRDDGIPIKVWLVTKPDVSILPNIRVVLDDTQLEPLVQFTEDGKFTEEEIQQIKATISTLISGLNEKITHAQEIKTKAQSLGNDKAEFYADKAIDAYKGAIDALEKAELSDDTHWFLNWLNVAKKYEQAGDFYTSAAEKALYNEYDQAELDAKAAEDLINLANQYKPSIWASLSSLGLEWWQALLLIIVAVALIGAGYLMFGRIGAIVAGVIVVILFGFVFLGEFADIVDKLKFW
ncbi:MAG: hypothetical protein H0Z18_08005 [Thermococcus sp.]|uniref:hypothetical protein n=1 Tax=Thermococcus sp. TaxID=35749 RepID=UPI001DDC9FFF|nr:hypothetical protein [Thermococcus sp.]MBO8175186.1 hypothetical protein [Thermococcus sp.]